MWLRDLVLVAIGVVTQSWVMEGACDDDKVDLDTKVLLLTTVHELTIEDALWNPGKFLKPSLVLYNFSKKKLNFLRILYNFD